MQQNYNKYDTTSLQEEWPMSTRLEVMGNNIDRIEGGYGKQSKSEGERQTG